MSLYYFHLENGQTLLDDTGVDLADIAGVQKEALGASGEMLKDASRQSTNANLWNGTPWRMWVTDRPNAEGKTVLTLRFTAETQASNSRPPHLQAG